MTRTGLVRLDLLGVEETCWKCRGSTVALIGVRPHGEPLDGHVVSCQEEAVLACAAEVLPTKAAAQVGVGPIKTRFSRTRTGEYLSNGCVHCDALLGDFFLYHETLPEVLAVEGVSGLVTITTVGVRMDLWERVVTASDDVLMVG